VAFLTFLCIAIFCFDVLYLVLLYQRRRGLVGAEAVGK
jgi:hypothetical protein